MKLKPISLIIAGLILAGCATQAPIASNVIPVAQSSCRVLDARAILLRQEDPAGKSREIAAGIAGGTIGYYAGRSIGGGRGRDLAKVSMAIGGYQIAKNRAARNTRDLIQPAVIYVVQSGSRNLEVVQASGVHEKMLAKGDACRLIEANGNARVVPR